MLEWNRKRRDARVQFQSTGTECAPRVPLSKTRMTLWRGMLVGVSLTVSSSVKTIDHLREEVPDTSRKQDLYSYEYTISTASSRARARPVPAVLALMTRKEHNLSGKVRLVRARPRLPHLRPAPAPKRKRGDAGAAPEPCRGRSELRRRDDGRKERPSRVDEYGQLLPCVVLVLVVCR